jgi:mono/diheme cytochrome c family protein
MKNAVFLLTLALSACKPATTPTQVAAKTPATGGAPAGGPPPPPPYQIRAELPSGDRLAGGGNGEHLFSNRCGSCHLAGGMGTNLLTKQRMMAGQTPETGLLANRTDLTADYVKGVVRGGKIAMPRLSRAEVTDGELDAIAAYLGKADK